MDPELKALLEKNLKLTEEIHEMTKRINRYVTFQRIVSLIYILIIVVPIVLSIIYLPPLLSNLFGQYQSLLNETGANSSSVGGILKGLQK